MRGIVGYLGKGDSVTKISTGLKDLKYRGYDSVGGALVDVPSIGAIEPMVANVAMLLFAYHVANLKGRNVDMPLNLAKTVTAE